MRTIIKAETYNTVTLIYMDGWGTVKTEEFWCPPNGGYVHWNDGAGPQVCERLATRGNTLSVSDPEKLLPLIRKEWRKIQPEITNW